jgi:hypothetical protein
MFNSTPHINHFFFRTLLLFASLFVSLVSVAQQDSTEIIYEQEVTVESSADDSVSNFDLITYADKNTVAQRKLEDSELKKMKEEDAFWYINEAPQREKLKPPPKKNSLSFFAKEWFRNLVWFLIVGGFIAIMIWFLASSNISIFQKKAIKIRQEKDVLSTENIFDIRFDSEIDKAIATKDFRLAIRLLYLQLLKELSGKQLIQYKQEKTNSDYVLQLFGSPFYKDFFKLTRSFEYSWYGKFVITEQSFQTIRNDFYLFKKSLV